MNARDAAFEAIVHLQGSCESLWQEYARWEDDDEFLAIVDEHIFNCVSCGWWFPIGDCNDRNGEWVCEECV